MIFIPHYLSENDNCFMRKFEDFQLTNRQIDFIKRENARKEISKYIKENGKEPEDVSSFYIASEEDKERYRRIWYAHYLSIGTIPPASGETESSGTTENPDNPDIPDNPDSGSTGEGSGEIETPVESGSTIPDEDIVNIPNNEIWYTTWDDNMVVPYVNGENELTGQRLLKNVYENGKGIMTFENDITYIAEVGFANTKSLKSIIIPASVVTLRNRCFTGSGVKSVRMHPCSLLESIEGCAFYNCGNLKTVSIPSVITMGKNIQSDGVTGNVFNGCDSLSSIIIPTNCTLIEGRSFVGCSNLREIIMQPLAAPDVTETTFYDISGIHTHYRFVGENTKNDGVNTLRIHKDSTGYYDGAWMTSLVKECGFHIEYLD